MDKRSTKQLLTILGLTVVCGIAALILAQMFDSAVSEVSKTRFEIEELTRFSVDKYTRSQEYEAVSEYTDVLNQSLPSVNDIPDILQQLEIIAENTNNDIVLQLEEGIVGEGEIEFTDETDRQDFLQELEVKEFDPQPQAQDGQVQNVALQQPDEQTASDFNINYLEISVNLQGTYTDIRAFINLLAESKYVLTINDLRMNKLEDGILESTLSVRAFIFEGEE